METHQIETLSALAIAVRKHERAFNAKIECCHTLQNTIKQMQRADNAKLPLLSVELQYHIALLDWHIHAVTGGVYEKDLSLIKQLAEKALTPAQPN